MLVPRLSLVLLLLGFPASSSAAPAPSSAKAPAKAAASPKKPAVSEGINLSWSDCGKAGKSDLAFACGVDTVIPRLIASFVPPEGMAGFLGLSAQLTVSSATALPDYWKHGADFCRGTTALSSSFDFTQDSTCGDFFMGGAVGGHAYVLEPTALNRARILIQCAVPLESRGPLAAGREYYGFALRLMPRQSATADTCRGCGVPICITLDQIQLFQPDDAKFNPALTHALQSAHVTWNGGPAECPAPTVSPQKAWGQVKNIHR